MRVGLGGLAAVQVSESGRLDVHVKPIRVEFPGKLRVVLDPRPSGREVHVNVRVVDSNGKPRPGKVSVALLAAAVALAVALVALAALRLAAAPDRATLASLEAAVNAAQAVVDVWAALVDLLCTVTTITPPEFPDMDDRTTTPGDPVTTTG